MACCDRCFATMFDRRLAQRELAHYRRHGPARSTRILIDALRAHVTADTSLLDIGGGVGGIQYALLAAGARHVHSVDASPAYLAAAREEGQRLGLSDRIEQQQGD